MSLPVERRYEKSKGTTVSCPRAASEGGALQEAERVHVQEDGGLRDFFGVAVGKRAAEEFGQHGALRGLEEKLEAGFLFQARKGGGGWAANTDFIAVMRRKVLGELARPEDRSFEAGVAHNHVGEGSERRGGHHSAEVQVALAEGERSGEQTYVLPSQSKIVCRPLP